MGNSVGVLPACLRLPCSARLAYAMPRATFATFRASIMSIYHCADNYIPGILRYAEMSDVMGLLPPSRSYWWPAREDSIFHPGGDGSL